MYGRTCSKCDKRPYLFGIRNRSPLRFREGHEVCGKIDSVTDVDRKYLIYSSESRCVHLFEEKLTRYMRSVPRYKSVKLRHICKQRLGASDKKYLDAFEMRPRRLPSSEIWDPEVRCSRSKSYHSSLNLRILPDTTSPRFVRPCTPFKRRKVTRAEGVVSHPRRSTVQDDSPERTYVDILKHLLIQLMERCWNGEVRHHILLTLTLMFVVRFFTFHLTASKELTY